MKKVPAILSFIIILTTAVYPQQNNPVSDKPDISYFITHTRDELIKKLTDLSIGIKSDDPVEVILGKIETFLVNFELSTDFPDDIYARAANIQALVSLKQGGYGIGSVLINQEGKIIFEAHNSQIQKNRSDLHAEMALMTGFENSHRSKKYMNMYVYKPGLTVFSSAEPCPMCFIRISTAGCDTKYCTPGPEDGMVTRISCLPSSWQEMAMKQKVELGKCSPVMQKLAHLLFYSYLLDNRGPK
jgi:tRNA(Arg) A34 adenosine deaminase TadA